MVYYSSNEVANGAPAGGMSGEGVIPQMFMLCVKLWAEKEVKLERAMSKRWWSLYVIASLFGGIDTGVNYHFLSTIRKNRRQI